MSSLFYIKYLTNNFTQKCSIPTSALRSSNINIWDFVSVNCGTTECICRVYPFCEPQMCVEIDDTVSCITKSGPAKNVLDFPRDFTVIKLSYFEKVKIKIILQNNLNSFILSFQQYSDMALELLHKYVVRKSAIVKCEGQEFADFLNIHSIIIEEIYVNARTNHEYGRISKNTSVEISGVISFEQLKLYNKFKNTEIGGFKKALELLHMSIKVCKKLLVLGPSGCGKSTLVKKFCCDLNCFLLILDGNSNLSIEKCNSYIAQLTKASKMLTNSQSVLFIDNAHQLTISNSKFSSFDILTYLIRSLDENNVLVIAATTHKSLLQSNISCLFETEVSLSMLSCKQRQDILESLVRNFRIDNVKCDYIANKTPGFIASDIVSLVRTAFQMSKRNELEVEVGCKLTTEDFEKVLPLITPSLLKTSRWYLKVEPIYWKDIGGMKSIKQRLQMCIEKPLLNPEIFRKVDLPVPKGVLLFGPPGCCKTTIARGLATECKANFFSANPSQIYSPFVGEAEKNISELFHDARLSAPSIIFLDELDSLVQRRDYNSKTVGVGEQVLSTLLTEMDGFGVNSGYGTSESPEKIMSYIGDDEDEDADSIADHVIVVAATNRPDLIDDALLRPGRLDVILYVPLPNAEERESILRTFTDEVPLKNVDLKQISKKTENFSGADLKHLHSTAALNALKENINAEFITEENYIKALENVRPSIDQMFNSIKNVLKLENVQELIQMYENLASKYGTFVSK